jgi:glycosyltransferase involved in cell wall biosynthesis
VLPEEFVYSVYTDRVGREGALGHDDFRSRWGPGWLEREEQFLLGARSIFVMGPSTKRILGDEYGVDPERVQVVGAGPGTEIGQIGEVDREPKRLLFVGTNWGLKGGPDVVAAYEKLVPHHADLELTMVGSDPVGLIPEAVQVLGRVDRKTMPGLFASHDVFVVPTHMEALGYSLLEALMHGLPAIGSSVGNQEWLIADAGTTVEPGDVDGLVDAVETVLDDYPTYKSAAIRRARQLRDEMTWEHVAEALTDADAYR